MHFQRRLIAVVPMMGLGCRVGANVLLRVVDIERALARRTCASKQVAGSDNPPQNFLLTS
jgi:hypothetical protein